MLRNKIKRKIVGGIRKSELLLRLASRIAGKPSAPMKKNQELTELNVNSRRCIVEKIEGEELYGGFLSLYKLRNYASAALVAKSLDKEKLGVKEKLNIARCFLSSNHGLEADNILDQLVEQVMSKGSTDPSLILNFASVLSISGLDHNKKIRLIKELANILESGFSDRKEYKLNLNWLIFKLECEVEASVDPLDYFDLSDKGVRYFPILVKFMSALRSYGHDEIVNDYLEKSYEEEGFGSLPVLKSFIICWPEWFHGKTILPKIPNSFLSDLSLLSLLHAQKELCLELADVYENCLLRQKHEYEKANLYKKSSILRTLLFLNLVDSVLRMASQDRLPSSVLPIKVAKGYKYFEANDFYSAHDCFLRVLEEDPADDMAAAGLRLALPRTGNNMRSMLTVRSRIGYGIKSAGRRGVRYLGSELTSSLLMSGDYLKGQYTIRNSPNWLSLKRFYQERFLNCELLLLSRAKEKSIFIIGDSGVGDEIRASQFYGRVASMFMAVTISCDPRLYRIFTKSFPNIKFIPVPRYRKGVSTRSVQKGEKRIIGFDEKVSNYLTEDCREYMDSSDYITYSQNLYFNYFAGALSRPPIGPYLNCGPNLSLPKTEKLRVGLLWRSHFRAGSRRYMYLELEDFLPLTNIQGLELWSVQHCIDDEEVEFCREHNINLIQDVDLYNDFEGMSGYLNSMDVLIGISSVPIELAAALGVEVWMLGFSPENYYLRTEGGKDAHDRYTMNSTVIAPSWIDFSEPRDECVRQVFGEVGRRLTDRVRSRQA